MMNEHSEAVKCMAIDLEMDTAELFIKNTESMFNVEALLTLQSIANAWTPCERVDGINTRIQRLIEAARSIKRADESRNNS